MEEHTGIKIKLIFIENCRGVDEDGIHDLGLQSRIGDLCAGMLTHEAWSIKEKKELSVRDSETEQISPYEMKRGRR
jgi:hypothetical protein